MTIGFYMSLLGLDQGTKYLARKNIFHPVKGNSFIVFQHIENKGIAGSLFSKYTNIPLFLNLLGVVITVYQGIKSHLKGILKFTFFLELTGSLSNLLDRCLRGSVTDFIRFPKAPWKIKNLVFNLADFMILVSYILHSASILLNKKDRNN